MKLSVIAAVACMLLAPAGSDAIAQTSSQAAHVQDDVLAQQISRRLATDPVLKPAAIKVDVDHGIVTLTGTVATEADRQKAARLARVAGVTSVDNKLVTKDDATAKVKGTTGTAVDKAKEGTDKAVEKTKQGVSKSGEVITDTWITSRIKTRYTAEESLRASDIHVAAKDHVVTLTGAVVSDAARTKAVSLAKDVEGVNSVVDKLTIKK
jgi:osmotically-inducible protein OsmY